ncbi:alpha/beta hydrolase [Luteimonas sp. SX5]|uniref:Alpha/beta hydrolase n=1 Tax=Luteimonas galliterrae TaxID=2940486 RepID=A0ABT0MK83_9GAMM|nr:alpha/beta hydrolase [Luteimonas galliterrae]MCL1635294.1 alpha/beta hydrolase [Luteimonas galliterrae]
MIRALILPGMDGTGELLTEFATALAPELVAKVVSYPRDAALGYEALTALVAESLPREGSYVLIAESFSGPIAIELAARKPEGLVGLVLCASFARAPRSRMLRAFDAMQRILPSNKLPIAPAMPWLMGRWSTRDWARRVRDAVRSVSAEAMRARLLAAAETDATPRIADIDCPLLYLKGSRDRLIGGAGWRGIRDLCRNAVCIEIEGPHFLLQAKPLECAAALK